MKLTLDKIAHELQLSKATVSFVLSGKSRQNNISEKTAQRVLEFCREHNYMPNIHAVRASRSIVKSIMLLVDENTACEGGDCFSEYNVARIAGGVINEAANADYSVIIRTYRDSLDENIIFNSFRNREIDGLIYYGIRIPESWLAIIRSEERRFVGISVEPSAGIGTVNIDNRRISRDLAQYFIERNCRKFVYIGGSSKSYVARERLHGFEDAVGEYPKRILSGDFSEETATTTLAEYLATGHEFPDAVLGVNDKTALGALKALKQAGLRIPVGGGDNIDGVKYVSSPVVTFDYMPHEMGRKSFQVLYNWINGGDAEDIVLKSEIIIHEGF
ncbi:MAG: LacI family transcriptional regulator [Victivallales bacterium]|jgi:LacI family transcriptional regulator|nr:LacI family transcriptional regulator [Victivallales bacterium]